MARKTKPRLRYYARFTEEFGYLRAVIRNGQTRKYIITPIIVTRGQISRLDTTGSMRIMIDKADIMVNTRLREYTKHIWDTVNPLIASGEFNKTPGEIISAQIFSAKKRAEEEKEAKLETEAEAVFQQKAADAAARGHDLYRLTATEARQLINELKGYSTPEQCETLWKHWEQKEGGNNEQQH